MAKVIHVDTEKSGELFNGELNLFCQAVNRQARAKGFWDDVYIARERVHPTVTDSIMKAFMCQKVTLVISECSEAIEAIRKGDYGIEKKDSFEDEIADALLRLFDLCGQLGIDIERQIEWKMNYNESRPRKHGKAF